MQTRRRTLFLPSLCISDVVKYCTRHNVYALGMGVGRDIASAQSELPFPVHAIGAAMAVKG